MFDIHLLMYVCTTFAAMWTFHYLAPPDSDGISIKYEVNVSLDLQSGLHRTIALVTYHTTRITTSSCNIGTYKVRFSIS